MGKRYRLNRLVPHSRVLRREVIPHPHRDRRAEHEETEDDFERTLRLIEEINFDGSFSFIYSRRPGTPAASLTDDTPQDVKLKRLQRMQMAEDRGP
jgi:hypothetical protein